MTKDQETKQNRSKAIHALSEFQEVIQVFRKSISFFKESQKSNQPFSTIKQTFRDKFLLGHLSKSDEFMEFCETNKAVERFSNPKHVLKRKN